MTTKTKQSTITEETKKALAYLCARNVLSEYWDQATWATKLMDYIKAQGEEELQALAGFHVYCVTNPLNDKRLSDPDKQHQAITSTFAHDIGQMHDKFMSPRSSNYLEFWTNRNF